MSKLISIALLLVGAQVNLSALVPAQPGQTPPPWWVGGGLLWPFFADTRTLMPAGEARDLLTLGLGVLAASCFLAAAAAMMGWWVPQSWIGVLVVAGAVASIGLHVIWLSGWAVFPLLVDAALLWGVFGSRLTLWGLRA